MKKFFYLSVFVFMLAVFGTAVFSDGGIVIGAGTYDDNGYKLNYRYYLPEDADTVSYPVVLYLHTAGERGNDNSSQLNYGLPLLLFRYGMIEDYPAIYIFPQAGADEKWVDVEWSDGVYSTADTPETPSLATAIDLTLSAAEKYNGDSSRIYVTGISMGGYGSWDCVSRHPDLFAAAVPICGGGDPGSAEAISHTPVRAYHGDMDNVVPISGDLQLSEKLSDIGADAELTVIPGGDHFNIWQFAYEDSLDWMFSQRKESTADIKPSAEIHVSERYSKPAAVIAVLAGIGLLVLFSFIAYKLFYLLAMHYLNNKR